MTSGYQRSNAPPNLGAGGESPASLDAPGSSRRPRILDLFCGAGGAAMGYSRAGFEVVGVDIKPQPRYPFEFHQYDALEILDALYVGDERIVYSPQIGLWFDAGHASPPCPEYSDLKVMPGVAGNHPKLVDEVRELLEATGLPYIIENVPGAPLAYQDTLDGRYGVRLDGPMFHLEEGAYGLDRVRWFECSFPIEQPASRQRRPLRVSVHGGGQPGREDNRDERVMGIDWMTKAELNQAIPPAYTEFIGTQLMAHLKATVAA